MSAPSACIPASDAARDRLNEVSMPQPGRHLTDPPRKVALRGLELHRAVHIIHREVESGTHFFRGSPVHQG